MTIEEACNKIIKLEQILLFLLEKSGGEVKMCCNCHGNKFVETCDGFRPCYYCGELGFVVENK